MKDPRQSTAEGATLSLVCRDIELSDDDRKELEKSEAALAHVLPKIHRIDWAVSARAHEVEVHGRVHTQLGDYEARGEAKDARSAIQVVTKKLLAQQRAQKEASLGSRRAESARAGTEMF
jgi:hypothetical protein